MEGEQVDEKARRQEEVEMDKHEFDSCTDRRLQIVFARETFECSEGESNKRRGRLGMERSEGGRRV
eukprot:322922-Hanusia_phi.AAC.3